MPKYAINEYSKETLLLTNECFFKLHQEVINHFNNSHNIDKINDSQLYGFGNYNDEKPNLKNDLELITRAYVNGKYLYNKYRETVSGKPTIKISGEYKHTLFNYIGYKDIYEFTNSDLLNEKEKKIQLALLDQKSVDRDYYYVSYYFSEDKKMNKGTTIFYNNWKTVEMKYVYKEINGEKAEYKFHANVINSDPFIFIDTKFYLRNKKAEGARCVFFIGKSAPTERYFLKGTYSGFDKYDRAIAGVMILRKFDTFEEVEEELNSKEFNPSIAQELNQKRIVVESNIIKDMRKLSKNSPFAKLLSNIPANYHICFLFNGERHNLNIKILKYHYNVISLNDSIIIEEDNLRLMSNGRILKLDFSLVGVFFLQTVSIYVSILDFSKEEAKINGSFTGIDVNNNIVSGEVGFEMRKEIL